MTGSKRSVIRFFVEAHDGRRSAEWRVWTGKDNNVSDELYATPRDRADDFKFSIHSNGYSQFGFSEAVREKMRPGDRDAIAKWKREPTEVIPGWRVPLILQFPASDLREPTTPPSRSAIAVSTDGAPGTTTFVYLAVGASTSDTEGLDLVGVLDKRNGGQVAIVHQTLPIDMRARLSIGARVASRIPLVIPGTAVNQPYDWLVDVLNDGTRAVTEFVVNLKAEVEPLPSLPGFDGRIGRWREGPAEFRHLEVACAVLVYRNDGTAHLFVDQHSRCDHKELAGDAGRLIDQIRNGQADGWGELAGGDLYTLISTRRVLAEHGWAEPVIPVKK